MTIAEDLAAIALQERELRLPRLDGKIAWRLGVRLRDVALAENLAIVVDIRRFGQPLFYAALDGTSPDNAEWARRKGNVVARFHRSSYFVGLELQSKNGSLLEKYGLPPVDYAAHGGAFPLIVAGSGVIGSVTVSGLPQRDDHELVVRALCAECGCDYAGIRLPPA